MPESIALDALHLLKNHGYDFWGFDMQFIKRRLQQRMAKNNIQQPEHYLTFLKKNESEITTLVNDISINVSHFFRDPGYFNFLSENLLKSYFYHPENLKKPVRIWSAGCAYGEEPYSLLFTFDNFLKKHNIDVPISIFATDFILRNLRQAKEASYTYDAIKFLPHMMVNDYLEAEGNRFVVSDKFRSKVTFGFFDLTDIERRFPSESIFGEFDFVFCRNLLIYYSKTYQESIVNKLVSSLAPKAYLILGESEVIPEKFKPQVSQVNNAYKIFRKK